MTRRALLAAALESFEAKGWRGATFDCIAERAGVTRGALHHHFRSKGDLLAEALEWGWSEYASRLFDGSGRPTDPREWLESLLKEFVTLLHGDQRFRALASTTVLVAPQAMNDGAHGSARKHDAMDAWRDRILAALDGTRPSTSPRTAAGLVLVLLQGLTVTAVTRPDDLPQPAELDAAAAALTRGLLT